MNNQTIENNTLSGRLRKNGVFGRLIASLLVALLGITVVYSFNAYALPVINKYRDVIKSATAEQIFVGKHSINLEVYIDKAMEAYFVPDSQEGEIYVRGAWRQVHFEFLDDKKPNSTKPVNATDEAVSYGVWKWGGNMCSVKRVRAIVGHITDYDINYTLVDGELVKIVTGNRRKTIIGPFDIDWSEVPHSECNELENS